MSPEGWAPTGLKYRRMTMLHVVEAAVGLLELARSLAFLKSCHINVGWTEDLWV